MARRTRVSGFARAVVDQLEAVREVLRAISRSPFDMDGVLGIVVERLARLSDADIGMVLVNDRQAELEQELLPGDTLSLFPLVGGG